MAQARLELGHHARDGDACEGVCDEDQVVGVDLGDVVEDGSAQSSRFMDLRSTSARLPRPRSTAMVAAPGVAASCPSSWPIRRRGRGRTCELLFED